MATIDDWKMPKIVHFSGIENTEHSIKDIIARPKKSTNKELSKQASTETRVVMKSPSGDDRVPRMVHFSDGGIPGHTFNHAADTRPKAILVKEPCSTSTVIKSHGNHDTKKVAKETMPPVTDNRVPKMVHFADGSFPGYVDPNATGARPKMRLKLETKKCAPIETAIERNKPTIMSPKQQLNKPTSMEFCPELNESIINTSPDGNYFAKVTCQEESRPDIASFTNVKPVAKERYVGQTYDNTYSNFYRNPQDYDKPMEWEKKRNPRNVEEFFSVNREYKESLAFCHPPPKIKHVYSRKLYSFNDPYRTDHFTAHDWAEYSAWEHYEMDYLGRHSSDNIIRKLDQTLAQNAYHPHTYLPYNHSESWWTVRTREDMTPDVYNQEATGGAEPVQGSSGIDQRYSRERAQRNNSRGEK